MEENSAHGAGFLGLSKQIQGVIRCSAGSGQVGAYAGGSALSCYLDVILLVTSRQPFS
jgi:hypothetical protein